MASAVIGGAISRWYCAGPPTPPKRPIRLHFRQGTWKRRKYWERHRQLKSCRVSSDSATPHSNDHVHADSAALLAEVSPFPALVCDKARVHIVPSWCVPGRDVAQRLLRTLHRRWFGLDLDYRISIYVLMGAVGAPVVWSCRARSDGEPSVDEWPLDESICGLMVGGIVNACGVEGQVLDVRGLPEQTRMNEIAVAEYLASARISAEKHRTLSWPFASMQSVLVRAESGRLAFILLIERRSGLPIGDDAGTSVADELQTVALTWPYGREG